LSGKREYMKTKASIQTTSNRTDILLSHNNNTLKESNSSFWKNLFFGPHKIEGEEIDDEENEAVMQQLMWWSRME
jgi:hypothetical protein